MPDVTIRRNGEFVRRLFEILQSYPEGLQAKDALGKLAESVSLTDFEKGYYPSGSRRFEKIVRFATIAPVKAGWLVKSKGTWILTPDGKIALDEYKDPEEFTKAANQLFKTWKGTQSTTDENAQSVEEEDPSESAVITLEEAEDQAWASIEKFLRNMPPYDLQTLVAALLKAMGYYISWNAPPGPDQGIDIIAYTDALGTQAPRIKVQVKRQADSISADGLRSFMAVLGDQDVGIFVSTGGFTSAAEKEARAQEKRRITLINAEQLFDLWVQHLHKLSEIDRQRLPLKQVYYLAPIE